MRGIPAVPFLIVAAFTRCTGTGDDDGQSSDRAADVVVRPPVVRLRAGDVAQLAAQANDSNGRAVGGAGITYSTTTPRMIRVSPAGAVSSLGPVGDGSITVASGSTSRVVPVVIAAGVANTARVNSGGGQSGEAGTTLPEPIIITVIDAFGNLVPRADVTFQASGGGSAEPSAATTDATGVARTVWSLGQTAGPQTLRAIAGDANVVVEATAVSGRMASIESVGALVRRTSAGDTVPVRLRAADRHGNGVSGVVVAFTVARGDGMVAPARVETGADGLAQTRWATGTTAGLNTLRARAIDVRDTTIVIELRTYGGAAATVRLIRGSGQRAATGAAVPVAPVVSVVDAHGNAVAAARVRFIASSGGTVEPPEAVTDDEGQVRVGRWVLGPSGANVLSVIVDGVADTLRVVAQARPR
jgi:adhesin/invasin